MTDPNREKRDTARAWATMLLSAAIAAPAIGVFIATGPQGWFWPLLLVGAVGFLPASFIADAIVGRLFPHKPDPVEKITGESYAESLHRAVRELEQDRNRGGQID